MARTRIATVGYLNAHPLTVDLDPGRFEVVADHPSVIAALLARGEVDVALVPVASVLRQPGLRVVPGFCIGAEGPVTSVLLVAETPPPQWTRVALDGVSRSSAALARVLLAGPLKDVVGEVEVVEVGLGAGMDTARGTTAGLVIGDAARVVPERLVVRIDLAETWTRWTGLPFVFAVWAGRPDLDPAVIEALREGGRRGLAARWERYSGDDLVYLTEDLRYALDDRALMGLRRFAALGHRLGLFPRHDLEIYGPATSVVPRAAGLAERLDEAVGGRRLSAAEALCLERGARLADLAAAAELSRYDRQDPDHVVWMPVGSAPPATVAPEQVASEVAFAAGEAGTGAQALRGAWVGLHEGADLSAGAFLEMAEAAHAAGLSCVIPLVVGLGESAGARWDFLEAVRDLQDRTGVFVAAALRMASPERPIFDRPGGTPAEFLRVVATARLFLDNVGHFEAPWATDGVAVAQAALHHGCDSLGAVPLGDDPALVTARVERDIRDAGWEPVRVDARYQPVGGAVTGKGARRHRLTPDRARSLGA